jgi:hypothetical protein
LFASSTEITLASLRTLSSELTINTVKSSLFNVGEKPRIDMSILDFRTGDTELGEMSDIDAGEVLMKAEYEVLISPFTFIVMI